jgi:hypothetical protein
VSEEQKHREKEKNKEELNEAKKQYKGREIVTEREDRRQRQLERNILVGLIQTVKE